MDESVQRALDAWGLGDAHCTPFAQRENRVFQIVSRDNRRFALKQHRPGLRTPAQLAAEHKWLQYLAEHSGLHVPAPVSTTRQNGQTLVPIDGWIFSLTPWIEGQPMANGPTVATAYEAGRLVARMHAAARTFIPPAGFERADWSLPGLVGPTPLWGRFWEAGFLSPSQQAYFKRAASQASALIKAAKPAIGLIHADLVLDNILVTSNGVVAIDFDDLAWGYRGFDIATCLNKLEDQAPQVPQATGGQDLVQAFWRGYGGPVPPDPGLPFELWQMLRALSYLGWIDARMHEPAADQRQKRMLEKALDKTSAFLAAI